MNFTLDPSKSVTKVAMHNLTVTCQKFKSGQHSPRFLQEIVSQASSTNSEDIFLFHLCACGFSVAFQRNYFQGDFSWQTYIINHISIPMSNQLDLFQWPPPLPLWNQDSSPTLLKTVHRQNFILYLHLRRWMNVLILTIKWYNIMWHVKVRNKANFNIIFETDFFSGNKPKSCDFIFDWMLLNIHNKHFQTEADITYIFFQPKKVYS